jgi:hypothetical protein
VTVGRSSTWPSKWLELAGDDPKTLKLIAEVEALKGPAH